MSHFYAEIKGNRGLASRMGSEKSGIWGHIRGWGSGVEVQGYSTVIDNQKVDVFYIYQTSGSGMGGQRKLIGAIENGHFISETELREVGE